MFDMMDAWLPGPNSPRLSPSRTAPTPAVSVLRAAEADLKVRLVHASRGKSARAEPIALKFEAGRGFFAGEFPELEAELAGMQAGGGYEGPSASPDRADAMVWALWALLVARRAEPRVHRM